MLESIRCDVQAMRHPAASLVTMCWLLHGKAMSLHSLLKVFICLLAGFEWKAIRGGVPVHVTKPAPTGNWAVMLNVGRPDFLAPAV
jgi:hypothetical protein